MLLLRLIVVSSLCWVARCDLLDLYVQHMDEAMKTLAYRSRHHRPRDVRIRRSVREEQPLLRIGATFKKQRLDVDKDWYAQWKAKRKILPYKEDGLDFPNSREENLDPNQHELVNHNPARLRGESGEETTTTTRRRYAINNEQTTDHELEIEVSKEESTRRSDHVDTSLLEQRMSIDNEDRSRGIESREETTQTMDFRRDIENVGNSQYEIIGEGSNIHRLDDPILKGIPKSRDRVPKKYIPATDKLAKLFFRGHAKYVANSEEGGVDKKNRGRRSVKEPRFTRREMLDDDGEVVLEWDPSDEEMVTFKVTAKTLGYVGIGFNEKNHMKGADILLAWVDDHTGTVNLLDSHGIEEPEAALVTDTSQDVKVLGGSQNQTHTSVIFSRSWQTCDPQDHRLTGDTIRVLWALHSSDPELNTAIWPGDKRGGRALRLKTPAPHAPPRYTEDIKHWDVKLNQPPVSDNVDTTYWCKIFKAPHKEKHHMIGYTPLVEKENEDLVHHIILYECASTLPILGQHARIVGAPCYSPTMPREWESCLQPVLAWARGSTGEWLPEHVGISIAEHSEGSYYMLEVHYNNPSMRKVVDSSGVRLHLTPKLRPQEAGILVAGVAVSPLHLIPPKQKEYATAGYCTPHCTHTMFPESGVNIVSVVLHSHLAGRRLSLKHIRQGKELPRIVEDNHFDFEYQQSHTLEKEVKVLPGDELVAECVYGTLDRTKPTLGGYAASQEMCLAFVVHYPRTPLAACYSMTPLKHLFKTLGVYSFKGVTMDHLEKLFLTTRTDAVTIPSTGQQQLPIYPATRPSEDIDEELIREAKSALRAVKDYTLEQDNENVFSRLIIEEPEEFRGRTLAEHMLALPWTEELLARAIEQNLYHGRHMTFCRKRDDKLALPADIQTFPNYTELPEANETMCTEMAKLSNASGRMSYLDIATFLAILTIVTIVLS